jgi:hypothetical protein
MDFSLYHGFNAQGQHVFSWLSESNMTSTDADYSPLLRYIWQKGLLSGALWLGQLEFGFEVMHAGEETVSEVKPGYNLHLIRDGDPDDRPKSTAAVQSTTTTRASSTAPSPTVSSTATDAARTIPSSAGSLARPGVVTNGWVDATYLAALLVAAVSFLYSILHINS